MHVCADDLYFMTVRFGVFVYNCLWHIIIIIYIGRRDDKSQPRTDVCSALDEAYLTCTYNKYIYILFGVT